MLISQHDLKSFSDDDDVLTTPNDRWIFFLIRDADLLEYTERQPSSFRYFLEHCTELDEQGEKNCLLRHQPFACLQIWPPRTHDVIARGETAGYLLACPEQLQPTPHFFKKKRNRKTWHSHKYTDLCRELKKNLDSH